MGMAATPKPSFGIGACQLGDFQSAMSMPSSVKRQVSWIVGM